MPLRTAIAAALAALLTASALPAQSTSANAAGETVLLDPFTVNTTSDKRWIATRSAAATKTNTPLVELAHRVTAFNAEFLADTGADTLLDATRFLGNATGGDRRDDNSPNASALKLRGFNVNMLEDGLPAGQGFFRRDFAGVDRVEFVKGASAVLFGSTQPGGTINIINKAPVERPFTQIEVGFGEHGDYRGQIDHAGVLFKSSDGRKALSYRSVVSYRDQETPRDFEFERSLFLQQSVRLRWNDSTLLGRVEYQAVDGREAIGRPVGVAAPGTPGGILAFTAAQIPYTFFRGEPGDFKDASVLKLHLNATQTIGSDWAAALTIKGSTNELTRIETFPNARIANQPPNIRTRNFQVVENIGQPESWLGEATVLGKIDTAGVAHELLGGANRIWNKGGQRVWTRRWEGGPLGGGLFDLFAPRYGGYTIGAQTGLSETVTRGNSHAFFAQDQFRAFDSRLIGVVGVRRDVAKGKTFNRVLGQTNFSNLEKTSPRYSLLFKATPWAAVYASLNEAFQGRPGGIKTGTVNDPLDPQESEQREAGVKLTGMGGDLSLEIAAFQIVQKGFAVPDPSLPGTPYRLQSGEVTSDGWDADLWWNLSASWQLYGSFGYNDARITSDTVASNIGKQQAAVPKYSGGAFAKYTVTNGRLKGFSAGAGFTYNAGGAGDVANTFFIPSYTVWNAMARYSWSRYSVGINVENLFDLGYTANASSFEFGIPGDTRWAKLTLTARF